METGTAHVNQFLQIVAVLVLLAVAAWRAYERGRAVGWNEHYFEELARDRARRNRLGQFKTPERKA